MPPKKVLLPILILILLLFALLLFGNKVKKGQQAFLIKLYSLESNKNITLRSPYQILIKDGLDATIEIPISKNLIKIDSDRIWIRAYVISKRYRTGVHFSNGSKEFFSYHSGDGKKQLLLSEVNIGHKKQTALLKIVTSETGDKNGDIIVGPIIISQPEANIDTLNLKDVLTASWARDNNPNKDFWFDRYVSQTNNFAVTIPNPNNSIWERFFGIGVNDRFSTGDYFCFPDDKILLRNAFNNETKWIYLGGLPWKKETIESRDALTVRFHYEGPILLGNHMSQENAQKLLHQFWPNGIPLPKNTHLNLTKTYTFKTDRDYADVHLEGKIQTPRNYLSTWIIEDTAYMDFNINNPFDVKSLLNGEQNKGGIIVYEKNSSFGKIPAFNGYLYRLRNGEKNLAISYESSQSDMRFLIPNVLTQYLIDQHGFFKKNNTIADEEEPNASKGEYWSLGAGFNFSNKGDLNKKYKMVFISGFDKPENIPISATKALRNGL